MSEPIFCRNCGREAPTIRARWATIACATCVPLRISERREIAARRLDAGDTLAEALERAGFTTEPGLPGTKHVLVGERRVIESCSAHAVTRWLRTGEVPS